MEEWVGVGSEAKGRLRPYAHVPASQLRSSAREILKVKLDPPAPCLNNNGILPDYRGLGELAGFSDEQIQYFKTKDSPTEEILQGWKHRGTIGQLIVYLIEMERFDIIEDHAFIRIIERDGMRWQPDDATTPSMPKIQDPCVTTTSSDVSEATKRMSGDEQLLTRSEQLSGQIESYTAFVAYSHENISFVREMIKKLEEKTPKHSSQKPIKLLIPDRDLLGGASTLTVSADLIEARCHKLVVLISPSYFMSPMCDFLTKFALQLSPGAQQRKIVPVLVEKITQPLPTIIRHINVLDHTKPDLVDWFWDRLEASIMEKQHWTEADRPNKEQLENITLQIVPNSAFFTNSSTEDLNCSSTDPVDTVMTDVQEQPTVGQSTQAAVGQPTVAPTSMEHGGTVSSPHTASPNNGSSESLSKKGHKKTKFKLFSRKK